MRKTSVFVSRTISAIYWWIEVGIRWNFYWFHQLFPVHIFLQQKLTDKIQNWHVQNTMSCCYTIANKQEYITDMTQGKVFFFVRSDNNMEIPTLSTTINTLSSQFDGNYFITKGLTRHTISVQARNPAWGKYPEKKFLKLWTLLKSSVYSIH